MIPTALSMFSQAVSVTASVGVWPCPNTLGSQQGHAGVAQWVRQWSIFCNSYQVLLTPTPDLPFSKGRYSIPFLCTEWEGGKCFPKNKKTQWSHLIWGKRTWTLGVSDYVWGRGLIPSSNLPSWKCNCVQDMTLSQAHTAHHQIYGLRQSSLSDNQKASFHESKHKLFTPTQRSRDMQQHYLVCYEKLLLELKCNVKCKCKVCL